MRAHPIAIIGAGIGGLTAALGLLRAGQQVVIYEQAPELGEVGAGLSISPNAALGLDYLDMIDFMEREANAPLWQYTHHGETNEILVAIDRAPVRTQYGAAYYQIHRADFHTELVHRIKEYDADCIRLNHRLERVDTTANGYALAFAGGTHDEACAVIGADGLRSTVRDMLFVSDTPTFTGHMAWRGLIPSDALPGWYSEPASHVWVGPGKTCVCYPVRGRALVNFVGFARAESWVEEGWSVKARPEEIADAFAGWHPHATDLIAAVPEEQAFRWGLFARQPLEQLNHGRAVLIGDAGHPMLPWFGQGASSSIEDGVVLARCFEAAHGVTDAFERFNQCRLERVTFLQRESNLGGERLQALDPHVLKNQPVQNEDAMGIFRYNPATVPV
jgi:salicylate hydroxylase